VRNCTIGRTTSICRVASVMEAFAPDELGIGTDVQSGRGLASTATARFRLWLDNPVPRTARVEETEAVFAHGMCPGAHSSDDSTQTGAAVTLGRHLRGRGNFPPFDATFA
jgi:hypothetical protein